MQFIGFTRHKVLQTLYISLLILAFLKMDFYWDTPLAEKIRLVVHILRLPIYSLKKDGQKAKFVSSFVACVVCFIVRKVLSDPREQLPVSTEYVPDPFFNYRAPSSHRRGV